MTTKLGENMLILGFWCILWTLLLLKMCAEQCRSRTYLQRGGCGFLDWKCFVSPIQLPMNHNQEGRIQYFAPSGRWQNHTGYWPTHISNFFREMLIMVRLIHANLQTEGVVIETWRHGNKKIKLHIKALWLGNGQSKVNLTDQRVTLIATSKLAS